MTLTLFTQATAIGLFLAMPVGPIALFCIRNTLQWGMRYGVVTGIGAALADAVYGLCALFGMAALSLWLNQYHQIIHGVGGTILLLVGLFMVWNTSIRTEIPLIPLSLPLLLVVSFCLTLANPGSFLLICALYSNFEICLDNVTWQMASLLSLGIFLGSTLWWVFLSLLSSWGGKKIPTRILSLAHRIMGLFFIVIGCVALFDALTRNTHPCSL